GVLNDAGIPSANPSFSPATVNSVPSRVNLRMRLLSPASEMYKVPSLPITTPKGSEKPACVGCGASLKSGEPLPAIDNTCAFQLNLVGRGLRSFRYRTTPAATTRTKERMITTSRDLRIGKRVSQNQRAASR